MNWREEYKSKLVSADEAVKVVNSGDRVVISLAQDLWVIPDALFARRDELRGVEILQGVTATNYPWQQPGCEESFIVNCGQFTGPMPRQMMWERRADFTAVTYALEFKDQDEKRPGYIEPDVSLVVLSSPDEHGFCSFGEAMWEKKEFVKRAKKTIAEVDAHRIRTGGDNFIHVSEIDCFVEATPYSPSQEEIDQLFTERAAQIGPEKAQKFKAAYDEANCPGYEIWKFKDTMSLIDVAIPFETLYNLLAQTVLSVGPIPEHIKGIAHYVNQLLNDGDCIQIGTGNTSNPLVRAGVFDGKNDLGFHCEVAPPGIPELVRDGVFTGRYKNINQGRAVCTSFWPSATRRQDELEIIDGNPLFELYGSHYTNNHSVIAANDNHVSINNALYVDLTGQVNSETIPGFLMWNGPGGQMDWVTGALNSKGGRSITVLPATAVGGSISRIVPLLEEGLLVTVPRTFADFIVTEYGIASLLGKSQRRRAEELISIAHPDHRAELKKEAQKLFWP